MKKFTISKKQISIQKKLPVMQTIPSITIGRAKIAKAASKTFNGQYS